MVAKKEAAKAKADSERMQTRSKVINRRLQESSFLHEAKVRIEETLRSALLCKPVVPGAEPLPVAT